MAGEKDIEDYLDVATPPRPGERPIEKPPEKTTDPSESPYLKDGDKPLWISCRATQGCEGNYAVQTISGEIGLDNGGGSWLRYRCLTCGGSFHIVR